MRIPSRPWKQLEMNLHTPNGPQTHTPTPMPNDSTRHLQEDLLDTPLPEGWRLREHSDSYYARHPKAGQTSDHPTPQLASQDAHRMHQQWLNEQNADASDANSEDNSEDNSEGNATPAPPQPRTQPPTPQQYDADADTWRTVDEGDRQYAEALHQLIQVGTLAVGQALLAMRESGAYAALGCASFTAYVEGPLRSVMSRSAVFQHLQRAERYAAFLPPLTPEVVHKGDPVALLAEAVRPPGPDAGGGPSARPLLDLPGTKLDALAPLSDEHIRQYLDEGTIEMNGEVITRDDIEEYTAQEVSKRVAEVMEPHKEKTAEEREKRLKAEAERDALREAREADQKKIEAAEALERRMRGKANKLEEKRGHLDAIARHLEEATRRVYKLGLTPDDPLPDQDKVHDLLAHVERLRAAIEIECEDVLLNPELTADAL